MKNFFSALISITIDALALMIMLLIINNETSEKWLSGFAFPILGFVFIVAVALIPFVFCGYYITKSFMFERI